jgi:hypothetical protein
MQKYLEMGRRRFSPVAVGLALGLALAMLAVVTAYAAPPSGSKCHPRKGCSPIATSDTSAPSVAVTSPAGGATVKGTIGVSGNASDDAAVARVELSVDGGGWMLTSGTTSWSFTLDTTIYGDGPHTIAARASDMAGNSSSASVSVTVDNPDADTTAPSVSISSPVGGSTVSGTVTVSGASSDNAGVAKVEVKVDSGTYQAASGTASWTSSVNTNSYSNGSHVITARATDTSGNASTTSATVNISNSSTTSPSSSTYMVTPEGTTIEINSAGSWTAEQIYQMLKENGLDSKVGPTLTVKVQDVYASQVVNSAIKSDGRYISFKATLYLKGVNSTFADTPDHILGHEFGHVWTLYHLYMSQNGDWSSYLKARGIADDPRLDSSYSWSRNEIIAEDYRLLFGSSKAIAQSPTHMNRDLPDPRDVPGLRAFFLDSWAVPR